MAFDGFVPRPETRRVASKKAKTAASRQQAKPRPSPADAFERKLSAAIDSLGECAGELAGAAKVAEDDPTTLIRLHGVSMAVRLSAVYLAMAVAHASDASIVPPFGSPLIEPVARGLFGARTDSEARLVILDTLHWFAKNADVYERAETLFQLTLLCNCFSGRRPKADGGLTQAIERALTAWVAVAAGASKSKWEPTNEALAIVGLECNSADALAQVWKERRKITSRKRHPRSSKLPR